MGLEQCWTLWRGDINCLMLILTLQVSRGRERANRNVYPSGWSSDEIMELNVSWWLLQRVVCPSFHLSLENYSLFSSTSFSPWSKKANVLCDFGHLWSHSKAVLCVFIQCEAWDQQPNVAKCFAFSHMERNSLVQSIWGNPITNLLIGMLLSIKVSVSTTFSVCSVLPPQTSEEIPVQPRAGEDILNHRHRTELHKFPPILRFHL